MSFRLYCVTQARRQPQKDMAPGERHGLVTIVRDAPGIHGARFVVRCDCGAERVMLGTGLRQKPPSTHRSCKP